MDIADDVLHLLPLQDTIAEHGYDCPICLQDDDGGAAAASTGAWKETPCGHRFHGRCVEGWLKAKGSCPMCRRQVVTMPAAAATSIYEGIALDLHYDDDDIMEYLY